jgi:hypothetical protein
LKTKQTEKINLTRYGWGPVLKHLPHFHSSSFEEMVRGTVARQSVEFMVDFGCIAFQSDATGSEANTAGALGAPYDPEKDVSACSCFMVLVYL